MTDGEEPSSGPPPIDDDPLALDVAFDEGDGSASILRGAARTAVLLTAAGLVGQVFTLVRELFVAAKVGVSQDLDALLIAAVAPLILSSLLASGTTAAIVPSYLALKHERGRPAADQLLGVTLTWTVLIGIAMTIVVVAGAGVAVAIAGPGLDPAAHAAAIGYVPMLAPLLVFAALGGLLASTFQIHERMRSIALAWVAGPLASVIVTIALWNNLGLTALALAMTAQQAFIVLALIAMGLRYRILPPVTLRADRVASTDFVRHALPLTISASVLQFNLLTDRAVASLIAPGAVSALRYAEGVLRIPMNAIVPAWAAAIYPALVRASFVTRTRSFAEAAAGALRYVTAIFVPLAMATAAMAPLIIEVAYVRGAFDERAAALTSAALVGFAPLLFLTMVSTVLTGAHNARKRGVFLMAMGFLDAFMNAVLNVGFGMWIGVAGVALSTSVTMGVIQIIKAWRLGTIEETFPLGGLLVVSARASVASLVVAAPIALVSWNLPHGMGFAGAIALLIVLSSVGMIGYLIVGKLIGLDEPWIVARTMLRSPLRLRPGGR